MTFHAAPTATHRLRTHDTPSSAEFLNLCRARTLRHAHRDPAPRSISMRLLPAAPMAEPTATHAPLVWHETPCSTPLATAGVVTTVQRAPSRRSTSGTFRFPRSGIHPTAVQTIDDEHDTESNWPDGTSGAGTRSNDQWGDPATAEAAHHRPSADTITTTNPRLMTSARPTSPQRPTLA
jgi:hypothetical protein